jgi:phosphate transport system substrate-binding protein
MHLIFCSVAFAAAMLAANPSAAQDVRLSSRDGSLAIEGTLQGFDGEFYRVATAYGDITVDGQAVLCDGPGCPDLTAPFSLIRLTGAAQPGSGLLVPLWQAFARAKGLTGTLETGSGAGFSLLLTDPVAARPIAKVTFQPEPAEAARRSLAGNRADLSLTYRAEEGTAERIVALDAMVPIVAPENRLPRISTADLARALTGRIANWQELGGADMPVVLHALTPASSLEEALTVRLGNPIAATERHPDVASLAAAVARDPYALAITALSATGGARVLPLTDSCGFPLDPTPLAIKTEDYPLALPLFVQLPRRRLPLLAREFLDFLAGEAAQTALAEAGHIDRGLARAPLAADGTRLMNAIRSAGDDITLPDLQRLAARMAGAERLSLTFRFEDGSEVLDAQSQDRLAELARLIAGGTFRNATLVLAGFSDGAGPGAENMGLALNRARLVLDALAEAIPDIPADQLPQIDAFGEALPMACDSTSGGRRLNRRVEVWVTPRAPAATDSASP